MKSFKISFEHIFMLASFSILFALPVMFYYNATAQNIFAMLSFGCIALSILAVTKCVAEKLTMPKIDTLFITMFAASPFIVAFLALLPKINSYLYINFSRPVSTWFYKVDRTVMYRNSANDKAIISSIILFFAVLFVTTFLIEKFTCRKK